MKKKIVQLAKEMKSYRPRASVKYKKEVPDEFLDPLTYVMMEDPVELPSSKQIVDFKTIQKHLKQDQTDPFNRAPLDIDDVVRKQTLKRQISDFKTI
mmetsp:Transcript_41182/g.62638  ORF Transcript_41182/g.62638 Transcript_41182/m.62638 type:complete len:97 (+) Transcript_41182:124-414(+)